MGLDQMTKYFTERWLDPNYPKIIISHFLTFTKVHNYGSAYGLFQNQRFFLICVGILVIVGGIWFHKKIGITVYSRMGLICLLAGSFGNVLDRLYRGFVVDFIDIGLFPVFNIADMAIDIGVVCFIWEMWIHRDRHRPT